MSTEPSAAVPVGTIAGLDHIALPLLDAGAMVAFYRSLGLEVAESRLVVRVRIGSQMVNFHRPEFWRGDVALRAPAATPPCGDLCVTWAGSPDGLETLLRSAGAAVIEGPVERDGGRGTTGMSWYVRDPDGNLLEFIRYPSSPAGDGHGSDEAAITALVHAYTSLVDEGDVDAVSALFEHATWTSGTNGTVRRGAAEVRPVYEQLVAESTGSTRHLVTNLTVTVGTDGTEATSRCRWTVLADTPGGGTRIDLSGRYLDRFAKVDGGWRFAARHITVDLTGG